MHMHKYTKKYTNYMNLKLYSKDDFGANSSFISVGKRYAHLKSP